MDPLAPPSLDTDRLTLRAHELEDFPPLAAMWADAEVVRYIGGQPSSAEVATARFIRHRGLWTLLGYGFWVVRERENGALVGEVGLFRRDLTPGGVVIPEAGWVLVRSAHGRGYATEALRAMFAWADARPALGHTFCQIETGNRASIRVAEKCGYRDPRPMVVDDTQMLRLDRVGAAAS